MFGDFFTYDATFLLKLATALQVIGFVMRDQIVLRLLLLTGSAFYIAYYYTFGDQPQWEAMAASGLLASANMFGLASVVISRYAIAIPAELRSVYEALPGLEPGEFRQLMRAGSLLHPQEEAILTTEGEPPDKLCFVIEGRPVVTKGDHSFHIDPRCFIGEVTFMLGGEASATVALDKGGVAMVWERAKLERLLQRRPRLKQAFEALLSRDMARKVSASASIANRV